jgi:hypothetical protein
MSKHEIYEEKVELDWLVYVLLEESNVCPDECDSETIKAICKVLEQLELVELKMIAELKNKTKKNHSCFVATRELVEMMTVCKLSPETT